MNVEEAYAAVIAQWPLNAPALRPNSEDAVRAYGAARELKGHVAACRERRYSRSLPAPGVWRNCGDDRYCDVAKEIQELGEKSGG